MKGLEQAKLWFTPEFPELELLSATYYQHAFPRHTHEHFVIGTVECGVEATVWRDQMVYSPPGEISFTNPDEIHTGHAATEDGYVYRSLYPQMELLTEIAHQLTGKPRAAIFFKTPNVRDEGLAGEMLALHQSLEQPASSLERQEGLYRFLGQLVLRYSSEPMSPQNLAAESNPVRQVQAFIREHFAQNLRLEELSGLVGLSPFYLARVFRKTLGIPPHEYQTQLRVERAKRMLRGGTGTAEVALEVGFYDQSHLNRHFKRLVGVTAGQYAMSAKR